jgi:hypothetical protein
MKAPMTSRRPGEATRPGLFRDATTLHRVADGLLSQGAATIRHVPASASFPARVHPLAVAARLIVLALVAALTLIATRDPGQLRWIALLLVAALPAFFAPDHRIAAPLGRFAEVAITGLAAGSVAAAANATIDAGFGAEAILPYLVVPLLTAGLQRRATEGAEGAGQGGPRRERDDRPPREDRGPRGRRGGGGDSDAPATN